MTLGRRTSIGIVWNFLEQLARRGISIIVTLLLARFLLPQDFGLIAMMAVFIALGQSLMDSGFRQALIRMGNVTQQDYATAFYANIFLGLISYCVLYLVAPAIADFYGEPRLVYLVRLASLSIIIMSFQVVQVSRLSRKLNFKAQLKSSFPAALISGVLAICMAYAGFGVWALVAQMLANSLMHTILLWVFEGWRPSVVFSVPSLRNMYSFGYKIFLSGVIDTIFNNLYVIVIAKVFSASVAGFYFFASKIRDVVVMQLIQAVQNVTFPALASIQNDDALLKLGYKKILILMTFLYFPVVLFLAVMAKAIFIFLLPNHWLPAVPYFQLLMVASVLLPLHSVNLNILKVKGRSDIFLGLEIFKKTINALVLWATYSHGVHAILVGQIAASVFNFLPNSYLSSRLINYPVKEQLMDFMPSLLISSVVAVCGLYVVLSLEWSSVFLDVSLVLVMSVLFVFLNFCFNRQQFFLVCRSFSALLK